MAPFLVPTLAFFAALTTTFGNLAAYRQTNLKRLLAYSTIAHAGFMMMDDYKAKMRTKLAQPA